MMPIRPAVRQSSRRLAVVVALALMWVFTAADSRSAAEETTLASLIAIGADVDRSEPLLQAFCAGVERSDTALTTLPTTRSAEVFVRCDLNPETAQVAGAIGLSYSDGKLVLVELRGGTLIDDLTGLHQSAEEPVVYAGRDIYPSAAVVVDRALPRAWILSPMHLHAHLFLFEHPLLDGSVVPDSHDALGGVLPESVDMGARLDDVRLRLAGLCPLYEERSIEPATLPGPPEQQVQVDCFGLFVAGFPRKVELVFGDGRLVLIWILTGSEEQARVRQYLSDLHGAPSYETDRYIVWSESLALRIDVPEIMISEPDVSASLLAP